MEFFIAFLIVCCLFLVFRLFRNRKLNGNLKSEIEVLRTENHSLKSKGAHLELIESISHLGSWQMCLDRQTTCWSEELYKIYGYSDSSLPRKGVLNEQVIAPEDREKVNKEIRLAIDNRRGFAVEYQIIQPSGMRKHVLGQGRFIEPENKLVGTVQDITELKQAVLKLKINESLLREAEKVSHSGSWEWVDGEEFLLWSDEMYNIHGFLPHSVFINASFYTGVIHEDDRMFVFRSFIAAKRSKAPFKINYRILTPSGEVRHVSSTAEYKQIGLNNNYAYIGNTQDVTALREAQVLLEQKIRALNRSNQDLEQFAYVASHDLQEPLRKIQAFGQRLSREHAQNLSAEAIDYIDRMRKAAARMRGLIEDLLTFSKVTRDKSKFVKLELRTVIEKTLRELDFIVESKNATVEVTLSQHVYGVEGQLIQLFHNVIGNSLKFSRENFPPKIEISAVYQSGSEINCENINQNMVYCVVDIKDNGIGFDADETKNIFDIFHRLHSRAAYEGTGIGLAICKKITDYHSGFILADGEDGKGATFRIILPSKNN